MSFSAAPLLRLHQLRVHFPGRPVLQCHLSDAAHPLSNTSVTFRDPRKALVVLIGGSAAATPSTDMHGLIQCLTSVNEGVGQG